MNKFITITALFLLVMVGSFTRAAEAPKWIVYEGGEGPGKGKNIVFVTGDHEYRSEETLPALAQILSQRHGFRCTVLFSQDAATAEIIQGHNNIPGLEALKDADLLVIFTRFLDLPDDQMKQLVDYVESGRPVVGLRTATHAFDIKDPNATYAKYTWTNKDKAYEGGFGRQVLGCTWETHLGKNHAESTAGVVDDKQRDHPILRGVDNIWGESGAYGVHPGGDSQTLVWAKVLGGMTSDSPPIEAKNNPPTPLAWVKTYQAPNGKTARVFTTTLGASEDLCSEGVRRLLVNACYWAAGLDDKIAPKNDVRFVTLFQPTVYGTGKGFPGRKPADFALAALPKSTEAAPAVAVTRNVEFGKVGDHALLLDLYLPKDRKGNVPLVVWIHGGGWRNGSKVKCPLAWLAQHGYAVASIDYRLSGVAPWPAQIDDCRTAIRWARGNAKKYGWDEARIGVAGGSAGGHLVSMLGLQDPPKDETISSRVQAVCDFYGPSDFLTAPSNLPGPGVTEAMLADSNGARLLGGIVRDIPDKARQASPLYHVTQGDAPFLIIQGDNDPKVPLDQSQRLYDKLIAAGVPATLHVIPGAGHGGKQFDAPEIRSMVLSFFNKHLRESAQ